MEKEGKTPSWNSPTLPGQNGTSMDLEASTRMEKKDQNPSSNPPTVPGQDGTSVDLEDVLQLVGQFGRHQIYTFIILSLPVFFVTMTMLSYVFTAGEPSYRCRIPECGDNGTEYMPEWWQNAVPQEQRSGQTLPSRCLRYEATNQSVPGDSCPAQMFLNSTVRCDDWVFDGDECTIAREWKILCEDNQWKLTLVGTINSIGQFVGLPIAGLLSDRFGRKLILLIFTFVSCLVGIGRSFSTNYIMFVVLEFCDLVVGGNVVFASTFVLGVEQVGIQKRVLGATYLFIFNAGGEVLVGLVAWWMQDWRTQLRIIYGFGLFLFTYIWLLPESARWLLAKGHTEEAKTILRKVAKTNSVDLPEDVLKQLELSTIEKNKIEKTSSLNTQPSAFSQVMKSRILLIRILNCSFCWATNTFVYYGLSLNSVSLAGNKFLNFILVSAVEIPGHVMCYFIMSSRLGRKISVCATLLFSGVCCLAFIFIPSDMTWLSTTLFLLGKLSVTISFGVLYMFTTEMLPTTLRHSLFGFCSMVGRLGTVVAPQTPLLAQYMESLPLILFGTLALVSGSLALFFPETMGIKLPDTVEEAERIGKTQKQVDAKQK